MICKYNRRLYYIFSIDRQPSEYTKKGKIFKEEQIEVSSKHVGMKDYKTVLQEKLQIHGNVKIEYTVIDEKGPDHNKIFVVEVKCDGKHLAIGQGTTKKGAEMEAAHNALEVK